MESEQDKEGKILQIVFPLEDFSLIDKASRIKSLAWASYVRNCAVEDARKTLKENGGVEGER